MKIKKITAKEILDSRGLPTIEITVNDKFTGSAPAGTSISAKEYQAFPNEGIKFCIRFIKKFKNLKNYEINSFEELIEIEKLLPDLKANTLIALESAILKGLSKNKIWGFLNPKASELPIPLGGCIGGGLHIKGNIPDVQEFLLIPTSETFFNNSFANSFIYNELKDMLKTEKKTFQEAFAPPLSTMEILDLLTELITKCSSNLGFEVHLGLDVAASHLFKNNTYNYKNFSRAEIEARLSEEEQLEFISTIIEDYKLKYVEDPFHENSTFGFKKLTDKKTCLICGDDLIATNLEILKQNKDNINAVIIKPNQIGSLINTKKVVDFAKANDIIPIISQRSGETMDTLIAHLAVAWEIPFIKTGIYGKERMAKINELINIEKEILS